MGSCPTWDCSFKPLFIERLLPFQGFLQRFNMVGLISFWLNHFAIPFCHVTSSLLLSSQKGKGGIPFPNEGYHLLGMILRLQFVLTHTYICIIVG
jgi:hypothetical protein